MASTTLGGTVHLRARRTVGRFGNLRYSRLGSLRYGGRVKMHSQNSPAIAARRVETDFVFVRNTWQPSGVHPIPRA